MGCLGLAVAGQAQTTYYMNGLLRQPDATTAKAYLQITGGGGGGTVSNFTSGNANPLFTTSVANPTSQPALSFNLLYTPLDAALFTGPGISNALGSYSVLNAVHANVADSISGGAGTSPIDIGMTNMSPYSNGTNFYLDFNWPAQVLNATGAIVFNFATNWGLINTSRVANIEIAPTNYGRNVYFTGAATNWHFEPKPIYFIPTGYGANIRAQIYGQLDTNVVIRPWIDDAIVTSNTLANFTPTNLGTGLKVWLDASSGVFQDELLLIPAADGRNVRGWKDLSGVVGRMTNSSSSMDWEIYHNPNSGPLNVPCVEFLPGSAWVMSPSFSAISQPFWSFFIFYGRGGGATFDGVGVNNRFFSACAEVGQQLQVYGGSSVVAAGPLKIGWHEFTFGGNGASSVIRTNGVQAASGNDTGATVVQWIMGGDTSVGNALSQFYIAEVIIATNLTAVQVTNTENYLMQKYACPR